MASGQFGAFVGAELVASELAQGFQEPKADSRLIAAACGGDSLDKRAFPGE